MEKLRISDAHCHLGTEQEREYRAREKIASLFCAGEERESRLLREAVKQSSCFLAAYGIHPWKSGEESIDMMLPYLKEGVAIGEIGMDSVWCQVPLTCQERIFQSQLEIAKELKKPVILHTKGQEKQIGEIIRKHHLTYLVHWYSSLEHLETYLNLDCYFTLGPDLKTNPAVRQVAKQVSLDRLMVETDGIKAVSWALGDCKLQDMKPLLQRNMEELGRIKGVGVKEVEGQIMSNFQRFLGFSLFTEL